MPISPDGARDPAEAGRTRAPAVRGDTPAFRPLRAGGIGAGKTETPQAARAGAEPENQVPVAAAPEMPDSRLGSDAADAVARTNPPAGGVVECRPPTRPPALAGGVVARVAAGQANSGGPGAAAGISDVSDGGGGAEGLAAAAAHATAAAPRGRATAGGEAGGGVTTAVLVLGSGEAVAVEEITAATVVAVTFAAEASGGHARTGEKEVSKGGMEVIPTVGPRGERPNGKGAAGPRFRARAGGAAGRGTSGAAWGDVDGPAAGDSGG